MTRAEKTLCLVYGVLALLALVGTQWVLADYFAGPGTIKDFMDSTVEGNAATFVTIDLLVVAAAAVVFMIADGRQHGVRWLWVYVLLVFVIAVSVAFPLYLIARTRTVAAARTVTTS